ncbi:hypothetical protein KY386_03480 [Candidatus Parcubacteria bacterium]|nr:hypothetical protein [Candidatus Parcubacteria bacterium]
MSKLKRSVLSTILSLLVMGHVPMSALATTEPTSSGATQPIQEPATGSTATSTSTEPPPPAAPAEADAVEYTQNPETGNWESDKYIWDPATGQTQPKQDPGYYYNPETGLWDTNEQVYNPATGTYEQVPTAAPVSATASPAAVAPAAAAAATAGTEPSLSGVLAALLGEPAVGNTGTGPGSTNTAAASTSGTGFFDLFSRAVVTNNINSQARSGDASVSGNTVGGDAASGAASVIANLLNLLNSAWSWSNGGLNFFARNIFGSHTGDIMLSPGSATGGGGCLGLCGTATGGSAGNLNTGPDSTNTATSTTDNGLTVNARADGEINNNLNLLARSGDASVSGNTVGGGATSGDALALVNILNLINASIGAGQSFFGLINVFGDLNGDILFPAGFLDTAIGSGSCSVCAGAGGTTLSNANTGPGSTNTATGSTDNAVAVDSQNSVGFNNNIETAALSGDAAVSQNTVGGQAATGDAATRNNLYNLANTSLFGDNAILVLVNVMGHWVGGIMNLAGLGGSSGALLTGNAVVSNDTTGPDSANTVSTGTANNLDVNSNVNGSINNNVRAGAISGDATVSGNTEAGDATSGDATVVSSVANLFNSSLNLKNWFGVLVVNVFGDWFGSVNRDTPAGTPPAPEATPLTATGLTAADSRGGSAVVTGSATGSDAAASATVRGSSGGVGGGSLSGAGIQADLIDNAGDAKVASASQTADQAKTAAAKSRATGLLLLLMAVSLMAAAGLFKLDSKLKGRSR